MELFDYGYALTVLPLAIALTVLLAATGLIVLLLQSNSTRDEQYVVAAWLALVGVRAMWRMVARPRPLRVPPPEPPAFGGPYR